MRTPNAIINNVILHNRLQSPLRYLHIRLTCDGDPDNNYGKIPQRNEHENRNQKPAGGECLNRTKGL